MDYDSYKKELKYLKSENNCRSLTRLTRINQSKVIAEDCELISFSCNDYLGLSVNKLVKKVAIEATEKYGVGSASSRLISGDSELYHKLENLLSSAKNTEKSLIYGSGYLANIGVISSLVGKGDLIIADKLVHACIIDGMKLSGAKFFRFKHNDIESCLSLIRKHRNSYDRCLIITEHVFSMDGDVAPIDELYKIANANNALLMTDDAHGFGVLPAKQAHIQMGTLSKAVGAYGGYVCADGVIVDYLINKSRSFIYSTALPPGVITSAIKSVEIIKGDKNTISEPLKKAQYFTAKIGLPKAESAIVPIIIGDNEKAMAISNILKERGFLVSVIRPPTVPKGTARLRLTFSTNHKYDDIDRLIKSLDV